VSASGTISSISRFFSDLMVFKTVSLVDWQKIMRLVLKIELKNDAFLLSNELAFPCKKVQTREECLTFITIPNPFFNLLF